MKLDGTEGDIHSSFGRGRLIKIHQQTAHAQRNKSPVQLFSKSGAVDALL
jgi:hypothetical protein